MKQSEIDYIDPLWSTKIWSSLRLHVHQLIAWGYEDAKIKIGSDHEEQEITGFITEAIQNRLRSPVCPRWCNQYALKEDNPVPGKDRTGKRRKRPDLIFESTSTLRPEYIFEAKRLRKQQKYREEYYLGEDGLQRYIREEYAARYPEAGMIGYVQYDTPEQWKERLKMAIRASHLENISGSDLKLQQYNYDVQVIDVFPDEWVSEHMRYNRKSLNIYHILLNCCATDKLS